jgi:hypothetical protein
MTHVGNPHADERLRDIRERAPSQTSPFRWVGIDIVGDLENDDQRHSRPTMMAS